VCDPLEIEQYKTITTIAKKNDGWVGICFLAEIAQHDPLKYNIHNEAENYSEESNSG